MEWRFGQISDAAEIWAAENLNVAVCLEIADCRIQAVDRVGFQGGRECAVEIAKCRLQSLPRLLDSKIV